MSLHMIVTRARRGVDIITSLRQAKKLTAFHFCIYGTHTQDWKERFLKILDGLTSLCYVTIATWRKQNITCLKFSNMNALKDNELLLSSFLFIAGVFLFKGNLHKGSKKLFLINSRSPKWGIAWSLKLNKECQMFFFILKEKH